MVLVLSAVLYNPTKKRVVIMHGGGGVVKLSHPNEGKMRRPLEEQRDCPSNTTEELRGLHKKNVVEDEG